MSKPAEYTQEELEAARRADKVYFLRLFHAMCVTHYRAGNDLPGLAKYISDTIDKIEKREKAA